MPVQPFALATSDTIGAASLLFTILAALAGAWWGHRNAQRKIGPEVAQLRDQAADAITQAAKNAVDVVETALRVASTQLAASNAELGKLQTSLSSLESLLNQARADLATAVSDRDDEAAARRVAEERVVELTAKLTRLRERVDQLEERTGTTPG